MWGFRVQESNGKEQGKETGPSIGITLVTSGYLRMREWKTTFLLGII